MVSRKTSQRGGFVLAGTAIAFVAVVCVGLFLWLDPMGRSESGADTRSNAAAGRANTSGTAASAASDQALLRYAAEYPAVAYSTRPAEDRVARLAARIDDHEVEFEHDSVRGLLDDVLSALDIDPSSQVLVFSTTSVQVAGIRPSTPRAIYFNDDTYVAWVQGANSLEIATMDPALGPVFYTLTQSASDEPAFNREFGRCLRCHDSYSLTGGGVPRFILGSGYIDTEGELVSHEAWILTTVATPLRSRWGGWYVTGFHGDQVHLGNMVFSDVAELQDLDSIRIGNRADLDGLVDTTPYLTGTSDIVALLVMQHQVDVQNAIARLRFDAVTLLAGDEGDAAAEDAADDVAQDRAAQLAAMAEPLVRALLLADEIGLSAPISGTSGFREQFEARGRRDSSGRSLRSLDLESRLFRYPLSFLIYSDAFDALPEPAKDAVYDRLSEILQGRDRSGEYDRLSADDRRALIEILAATKPEALR